MIRASVYGRLGGDCVERKTRSDKMMITASLAVNAAHSDGDEETIWISLAAFGKTGWTVWVHSGGLHGDGCLRAFWKMRRAEAEKALDAAGVREPKREKA